MNWRQYSFSYFLSVLLHISFLRIYYKSWWTSFGDESFSWSRETSDGLMMMCVILFSSNCTNKHFNQQPPTATGSNVQTIQWFFAICFCSWSGCYKTFTTNLMWKFPSFVITRCDNFFYWRHKRQKCRFTKNLT